MNIFWLFKYLSEVWLTITFVYKGPRQISWPHAARQSFVTSAQNKERLNGDANGIRTRDTAVGAEYQNWTDIYCIYSCLSVRPIQRKGGVLTTWP